MSTWASALLGPKLLVKEGDKVVEKDTDAAVASKKFVALYLSAHVSTRRGSTMRAALACRSARSAPASSPCPHASCCAAA